MDGWMGEWVEWSGLDWQAELKMEERTGGRINKMKRINE
jgi:hypothetical protein